MPDPISTIARDIDAPPLRIVSTPGRPSITPASRICLLTVDRHPHLLKGSGIDWGSGTGILAVAAATHPGVKLVVGLEFSAGETVTARTNAELNGVADRTAFLVADSYQPLPDQNTSVLDSLRGAAGFLIANPPASDGDDGLGWRRRVLREGLPYLRPGSNVLLQVSRQYGQIRTEQLAADTGQFEYRGVLETSDWVPFDQGRNDLRRALDQYVVSERESDLIYPFLHPTEDRDINAADAQRLRDRDGSSPRSQWRMHHLVRR
jgi:hypothetical protein